MFIGIRQFFAETNSELKGGWLAMLAAAAVNGLLWSALLPPTPGRFLVLCVTGFAIGFFWPTK